MMVDLSTISSLELIQNLRNAKSKESLFGLMDQTLTKMGSRILRSNILQPSTDAAKIAERYEAVDELTAREEMFSTVREAIATFVDTDRCLTAIVKMPTKVDLGYMEQSVNNVLMLKSFVDSIKAVWQSLAGARSRKLQEIRDLCAPEAYAQVEELIKYAINDDVGYISRAEELRNQRVFAIRVGVNGFLDVARTTYKEINNDAANLAAELSEEHEINFDLKFEPGRQFYLRFAAPDIDPRSLPEPCVNVVRRKKWFECQTLDLMKMNQKIRDAHNEVVSMSDKSIQELIDQVRTRIHPLFKISEAIALLDMLSAFAQVASGQDYAKPELTETLAIKAGRHPVREAIQSPSQRLVPNDVYATEQNRFQIITGCNMSGKSTYIRSIALMAVMAQTGCFVPASYASFTIFNQLFARVSTDSAIEANVSTFAAEMRDIAHILRNIEPHSLVIIDELGRGTSTTDGLAIAIAIAEALIESKAFVWFVTHFRDLPRILAERAGVVNLHLSVNFTPDDNDPVVTKMKMTYKISDGPIPTENQFYGLALARAIQLPERVVEVASQVSEALNEKNERRRTSERALAVARKRRLVLCLREQLMQARESGKKAGELRKWLKSLQDEFLVRMEAIEREVERAERVHVVEEEVGSEVSQEGDLADREGSAEVSGAEIGPIARVDMAVKTDLEVEILSKDEDRNAEQASVVDNMRIKQEMADDEIQKAKQTKKKPPFRSPYADMGESQGDAIVIDSDDARDALPAEISG
jgi:DNA mismatch repair protein MSH4